MCNCILQSTKESRKFPFPLFRSGRIEWKGQIFFLSVFFTRSMKVARFFSPSFFFNPFYRCSIHQAACVQLRGSSGNVQLHIETTWSSFKARLEPSLVNGFYHCKIKFHSKLPMNSISFPFR